LDVRLIEYRIIDATVNPYLEFNWEPTSRDAIILTRTNEIPKNEKDIHGNPGIFSTELNYIYKTTESVSNRFKYKLLIKNPLNGKEVWSETYMIYDMRITNPSPFVDNKLNMANELNAYTTSWESAVYGKVYQPAIRFNYYEVKDGDTTLNNIIIKYNSQVSSVIRNPSPGESGLVMDQIIGGIQFYKSIVNKIEPNMGVLRVIRDIDFIYYVGGQNFFTYMNVSEAQVNYGQAAPEFSNIKNGKGMFDSRFKIEVGGKELTVPSIDSLANGRFTKHLGFANYSIP